MASGAKDWFDKKIEELYDVKCDCCGKTYNMNNDFLPHHEVEPLKMVLTVDMTCARTNGVLAKKRIDFCNACWLKLQNLLKKEMNIDVAIESTNIDTYFHEPNSANGYTYCNTLKNGVNYVFMDLEKYNENFK